MTNVISKDFSQTSANIDRAYAQVREELFDEMGNLTSYQLLEDEFFVWKLADLNSAKEALEDFFAYMEDDYPMYHDGFDYVRNLNESGVKLSALLREVAWGGKVLPVWDGVPGVHWQEDFEIAMEEALCAIPEYKEWSVPKQKQLDENPEAIGYRVFKK